MPEPIESPSITVEFQPLTAVNAARAINLRQSPTLATYFPDRLCHILVDAHNGFRETMPRVIADQIQQELNPLLWRMVWVRP